MSLIRLGQSIINKTSKLKFRVISSIEELKAKFKISCPNRREMLRVIKKRNELINILNQLNRSIIIIDKTTNPLIAILKALGIAITTLKLIPIPTTTPGLTAGNIILLSDSLSVAKIKVDNFNSQIEAFKKIKQYVLKTINDLKQLIQSLDLLINHCLDEASKIDENNNAGGSGNLGDKEPTFNDTSIQDEEVDLNITLTEIEFINEGVNQGDDNLLKQLESSEPNEFNSYQGFKFAILTDLTSTSRFPKRYAVAKSPSGIVLLKGESSFSSSVQVLIDELKFIIDRDNLKAF